MTKYKLEYIWLDGYTPIPNLRGKTQIKTPAIRTKIRTAGLSTVSATPPPNLRFLGSNGVAFVHHEATSSSSKDLAQTTN